MPANSIKSLLCIVLFAVSCKVKECEEEITDPYEYPVEAAYGKTFEEQIEMYKIPSQTLHCLSTMALLKSCLQYPEMRMIWSRYNLQNGFDDVRTWCNGFGELWERKDSKQTIISLYKQKDFNRNWSTEPSLDDGRYMDDIVRVELIITQFEILHNLALSDKIELFQLVLDNQKKKLLLKQHWDDVGLQTSSAVLSRIMFLDKYPPMIEEYTSNEYMMLLNDYILILDSEIENKIVSLSEDYLKILKSKQQ